MEAAESEAGAKNHLNNVLSEEELANIPNPVVEKINTYIDKTFEEYLTAKALHEANRTQIGKKPVFSDAFTHYWLFDLHEANIFTHFSFLLFYAYKALSHGIKNYCL